MALDLHVHTTASDGCLTPSQVVKKAKGLGLTGIAITDHDNIGGIKEAVTKGREAGLLVIPGVELSCEENDMEFHILGLNISPWEGNLCAILATLQAKRAERTRQMVDKLNKAGVTLKLSRVRELAGEGSIGRPHIARALIEEKHACNICDAFDRYLEEGTPGYVPRKKLSPVKAISLIKEAGGVAVWAHPGVTWSSEVCQYLVEHGLRGVEAWHPDHDESRSTELAAYASRHGLLATGGSDFHCADRSPLGSHTAPDTVMAELQKLTANPL